MFVLRETCAGDAGSWSFVLHCIGMFHLGPAGLHDSSSSNLRLPRPTINSWGWPLRDVGHSPYIYQVILYRLVHYTGHAHHVSIYLSVKGLLIYEFNIIMQVWLMCTHIHPCTNGVWVCAYIIIHAHPQCLETSLLCTCINPPTALWCVYPCYSHLLCSHMC